MIIDFKFDGSIQELEQALALFCRNHTDHITLEGGALMFTLKADHPDVPFTINLPKLVDSEGNVLSSNPADWQYQVESTNPSAVEIIPDDDENPLTGKIRIGGPDGDTPATAAVSVSGTHTPSGKGFAFGAQFSITAGDPADIVGGDIQFEGLTEDEVPTPEEPAPGE